MAGKYRAFDPKVEVNAETVLGFIQCLRKEEIAPFLAARGLDNVRPGEWYPLQSWLDVLNDLAEDRPGQAMFDFVAVGMKIAEVAPFPPEFDTLPIEKAITTTMCDAYYMSHRGGDCGKVGVEFLKRGHLKITLRVPYPDDLMYGSFHGFSRRFLPGKHVTVYYDPDIPRREQGGEQTIVHLTWE